MGVKMNLNELAKEIAKRESGKKEVSVAQIKEILRILGDISIDEVVRKDLLFYSPSRVIIWKEHPLHSLIRAAIRREKK